MSDIRHYYSTRSRRSETVSRRQKIVSDINNSDSRLRTRHGFHAHSPPRPLFLVATGKERTYQNAYPQQPSSLCPRPSPDPAPPVLPLFQPKTSSSDVHPQLLPRVALAAVTSRSLAMAVATADILSGWHLWDWVVRVESLCEDRKSAAAVATAPGSSSGGGSIGG